MGVLKWITYTLLSVIGLGVVVSIMGVLAAIGATLGSVIFGAFIIFLGAGALNDYFENRTK